jgi:hypothetical protein
MKHGTIPERDVRRMALAWLDAEITRLRVLRADLAATTKPDTAEEARTRRAILAGRAKPKGLHWTQRPENAKKMRANVRHMARAKKNGGHRAA